MLNSPSPRARTKKGQIRSGSAANAREHDQDFVFFTTGGTIDKIPEQNGQNMIIGAPQVGRLLRIPKSQLSHLVVELMRKDSLDITEEERRFICEEIRGGKPRRIVVTHGTDTMVATARMAQGVTGKTVVFTGAMTPAYRGGSDAAANLKLAVEAARSLPPGIYIAMHGLILNPARARKNIHLQIFEEI